MKRALYPGTFDPITLGHIDIIKRAAHLFEELIIGVVREPSKKALLNAQERYDLVKTTVKNINNVKVEIFTGLTVDFAKQKGIRIIIRGLRMISDFEYEFQMALTNRNLEPSIETFFLMPNPEYSYVSSKLIKEIFRLGGAVESFLPKASIKALKEKIKN